LIKIDYSLEAALTNFDVLFLLEISFLLGCGYDWTAPSTPSRAEVAENRSSRYRKRI
jgi:hypothetical protein